MPRTSREYWDDSWCGSSWLPKPWDPRRRGRRGYKDRCIHRYFRQFVERLGDGSRRLIEIGCARSNYLPYFAREYGFDVTGLDYSEVGCDLTRRILCAQGVDGRIVCSDFFTPPDDLLGQFDALVSFGVVEHFEDTAACLRAHARFLKPGGLMLTTVPNMSGAVGSAQKMLNRPVFDIHVPLTRKSLRHAHENAGLEVLACGYVLFTDFGVPDLSGIDPDSKEWAVKETILRWLRYFSNVVWMFESAVFPLPANRLTSPFIFCTAHKPLAEPHA